jgi:hypothetical protein
MWNRFQRSDFQTETVGNALEAECYSKASSAAFISLFPISITSLIYRAGDGDRMRDVQLEKMDVKIGSTVDDLIRRRSIPMALHLYNLIFVAQKGAERWISLPVHEYR